MMIIRASIRNCSRDRNKIEKKIDELLTTFGNLLLGNAVVNYFQTRVQMMFKMSSVRAITGPISPLWT